MKNNIPSSPHERRCERQIPQLRGFLALFALLVTCFAPQLVSAQGASVSWQYMPIYNVLDSAYSPDGSMVAVSGMDSLQVFNVNTGALIKSLPTINTQFVGSVAFSPDGKTMFDAGQGASAYWLEAWNTSNWTVKNQQSLQTENPNTIAVSPDGTTIAVGGAGGSNQLTGFLELHSTSDLSLTQQLSPNTITIYSVSYSPDGTVLAASGANQIGANPEFGSVQLFNLTSGAVSNLPTTAQWDGCVAFSPDGTTVANGGGGYNGNYWGTVEVHNLLSGMTTTLPTTISDPESIQFSSNSKTLLVGGQYLSISNGVTFRGVAELWTLATGKSALINTNANNAIRTARFSPSGNAIELTGESTGPTGYVGVQEIWNGTGQSLVETLNLEYFVTNQPNPSSGPTSMSFSPDGKWVTYSGVNTNGQPAVGLFDAVTGQSGITFPSTAASIGTTAMSADGITVADGGVSGLNPNAAQFEIWNANSGALIASLPTKASLINQVAFSPDGKSVAGAGVNTVNGVEIWNVSNASLNMKLPTIGAIKGIAYSPDGTMLADGGLAIDSLTLTGFVEVWTLASQQKLTIRSGCAVVNSVAFSPDGTTVADTGQSPQGGFIVEVWNALTGAPEATYSLNSGWVSSSIAFTPDGSTIYVGTTAGLYAINAIAGNTLYNNGLLGVLPVTCLSVSPNGQFVGVGGGLANANESWMAVLDNPLYKAYQIQSLSFNPTSVIGGTSSTGTITITRSAPAGGITISLGVQQGGPASVPATVVIPAGQTSATFSVTTSPVSAAASSTVTASYQGSSKSASIVVNPPTLSGLSLTPGAVVGGNNSTGTVTLSGPAPSPGIVLSLSSNSSSAGVPTSVTVESGATSANFTVTTQGVATPTSASIAAANGGTTGAVTLKINPASLVSVAFSPTSVVGGNSGQGTVSLDGNAPSSGVTISLSTSKTPSGVSFPSSVTISGGSRTATFSVATQPVAAAEALKLNATLGGNSFSATLTIQPAMLQSVNVNPSSFDGGQSALGMVMMSGKVTKPVTVKLSSSNPNVTVPSSVTVSTGAASADFAVTSKGVSQSLSITITAKVGTQSTTCQITVNPATIKSLTLSPASVPGGSDSVGNITLVGVAPAGGCTVTLASSSEIAGMPTTVKVPAGKALASFTIKTMAVPTNQSSSISATLGKSVSATLSVLAPTLKSLKLSTTGVVGGQSLLGTVTLSSIAPTGGVTITVTGDTSLAVPPKSVLVPSGKSTVQFTIKTKTASAKTTASVTASYGGVNESASFTIRRS